MGSSYAFRNTPLQRRLAGAAIALVGAAGLWLLWETVLLGFVAFPRRWPLAATVAWIGAATALLLWCHVLPDGASRPRARATARLRPVPRAAWPWLAVMAPTLSSGALSLWMVLASLGLAHDEPLPPPLEELMKRPGGFAVLLLIIVGTAPLLEELAFRGWIQRPLERRFGAWPAILFTAFLFALAHMQPDAIPIRLAGGVALGYVAYATRSLWSGVVLHVAWNLGVVIVTGIFEQQFHPEGAGWRVALPAALAFATCAAVFAWAAARLRTAVRADRHTLPMRGRAASPDPHTALQQPWR